MAEKKATTDAAALRQKLASLNQSLEANNALLEEAQALTHLGSWQWDVATGDIAWSDELYRIYGLKPQERPIGFEEFIGFIHPDDRERINGAIGAAFQSAQSFSFEHRIVLHNKKVRMLLGKGKVVTDGKGNVVRMLGTSQDITEQKKASVALQLSDERFQAVTAATSDVIYDVDIQVGTMWFNDALSSVYGYPRQNRGRTQAWWLNHVHPEDQEHIKHAVEQLLAGKATTWAGEYRFKTQDGSYVDVRDRAFVIRDAQSKPVRMIGSILDITQQKELERAKDKFISLVSHQLRTPLTSMRLLSEMLSQGYGGELSKTQHGDIEKIRLSTVRMIQLVGDILNVSQIERGRLKVVPVPTAIQPLIQWHVDEVMPLAQERGLTIHYKPRPSIPTLPVDPILLGQILHNLLTNAIRYTRNQGAVITVDFKKTAEGFVLSVADQGIGIPNAVHPKIFSSFFRADNAVKAHGEGTGLGLYLVKLICDATKSAAWFESKVGKGTTFYVRLPLNGMKTRAGDKAFLNDMVSI